MTQPGSGLSGSLGFNTESVYGTYSTPNRWIEVESATFRENKTTYQSSSLTAGRVVQSGKRRVVTTRSVTGQARFEVPANGFGGLLNGLMGGTVVPVQQGATPAYLQTHSLMPSQFGKRFTFQVGTPDTTGVVRPYTTLGGKITVMEFTCSMDEPLRCTMDVDGRELVDNQALAVPSYLQTNIYHFAQSSVLLGDFGAEVQVDGITGMTLRIERPYKANRFYHGNQGLKAEPIANNWVVISGTITADFVDKTLFADRFKSDEPCSLIWRFVGPEIGGGNFETLQFTVPMIFFDGTTPVLEGPDVVSGPFPWVGRHDGVNPPITVGIMSSDSTLI